MIDFEAHTYTAIPDLDVASLLALGTALSNAMPRPLPDELRKPVKKLRAALASLLEASAVLPKAGANRDLADQRVDAAWEALHARLVAYDDLPHDVYAEIAAARALVAAVFPEGLAFLTLPHNAEWVESDKRLRAIDDGNLAAQVDALAGALFLREVRAAHAAYGDALGIAVPRVALSAPQLVGPALDLRKAVQRYARAVIGLVDEDELATVAMAESALRPILEVVRTWVRSHADAMFHIASGPTPASPIAPDPPLPALAPIPTPSSSK
ncbi:MAG: hypothetical protein ACHREM_16820 [Polyangiales bacterium]